MNGLGDHDHRGPAAEAVRLLDRRRRLRRRARRSSSATSTRPTRRRSLVGRRGARRAARAPARHAADPGGAGRGRRRDRSCPRCSTSRTTVSRPSARSRRAFPTPSFPWTSVDDVGPLLDRRGRHHARVAHRHDRDRVELRGPARRRGRPEPGDDRHRRRERRRRVLPGFRGRRRAGRAPRSPSSRAPRASSPGVVGAGLVVDPAAVPQLAAGRPARSPRSPRW